MRGTRNRIMLVLFVVSAIVIIALAIYSNYLMANVSDYLRRDIHDRMYAESQAASRLLSAEELNELINPEDMNKPIFEEARERLIAFAKDHNLYYVYYLREDKDGMVQWIVDNDTEDTAVNLASEHIEAEPKVVEAFRGGHSVTDLETYSVGYTDLISSYYPITDRGGNVVAVAGVDMSDDQMVFLEHQSRDLSILLIAGVAIVLIAGCTNIFFQMRKEKQLS